MHYITRCMMHSFSGLRKNITPNASTGMAPLDPLRKTCYPLRIANRLASHHTQ
jgi:hypothetical protein